MSSTRALLLSLVLLAFPGIAAGETCKYVDAEGRVIYSNTPQNPPKGAKKVKCFEDPAPPPAPAPVEQSAQPKPRGDERTNFPRVDGDTQRKRDAERRRILEQELASEQQQLEAAKQALAEQEAVRTGSERNYQRYLDRVQPYRDAVTNHERNIEAIQRELNALR